MGKGSPWRALAIWLIGLAAWATVAAPDLERRVAGGDLGTWRDAELTALAPFVALHGLATAPLTAEAADEDAAPASPSPSATGADAVVDPSTSSPDPTSTPGPITTPTIAPHRHPSTDAPLRILLVGDSIAEDLGWALSNFGPEAAPISVVTDTHPSTGLARPDYFDWDKQLALDISTDRPELVIVMIGGNDAQPFLEDGRPVHVGTPEWRAAYAKRVERFMRIAAADGRDVLWVGLPIMADPSFSETMAALDGIDEAEARAVGVAYMGSWDLFADAHGHYSAYLPDAGGRPALVREGDGIHLTMEGARRLERVVIEVVLSRWPPARRTS